MAYATQAQPAVFDDRLVQQAYVDLQTIRERDFPGIAAFFSHKHELDGTVDHVGTAEGEGFLHKGGLVYRLTLRELQLFRHGTIQGYALHDGHILPT
jgi:hypothetical protein